MPEKKRKSPAAHAADQPIQTRMTGSDGFVYVVRRRDDGTQYWYKTLLLPAKMPKYVGTHKIAVGEVSSSIIMSPYSLQLKVTPAFLKVLRKKPKYISRRGSGHDNAYIFGPLYHDGYYLAGEHGNDVAQTGILDLQQITDDEIATITDYKKWVKIFIPKGSGSIRPWDERPLLKQARKTISPRIIFVGTTHGGDVGADVYVHFNRKKEIDGLIIDNSEFA